jgi:hypothetical protein
MAVIILIVAAIGFLVCLAVLIKEFLPKDKSTAQSLNEMTQKGAVQVEKVAKKSQGYIQGFKKIVEGAASFIGIVELPAPVINRVQTIISKVQKVTDDVELITQNPDIFSLLALVSPLSSEAYGEPSGNYTYIITEDQDEPFQVNQEIVAVAQKIVEGLVFEEEKARALFDWFVLNIKFGTSGWKKHKKSMRHAKEIFEDREGVCAEMTILYIAMARAVGLEANYAKIEINNSGKIDRHACAAVKINDKYIYVDSSYNQFDAKHQGYTIMTDQEAVPHFKSLRGS